MSAGSDALPGTRGRKRVYLMRHGEVNYRGTDGESILTDQVPLTEEGERQAGIAGEALARVDFDVAVHTGVPRTVATVERVLAGRAVRRREIAELREIRTGNLRLLSQERFEAEFVYGFENAAQPGARFAGGERFADFQSRVVPAFERFLLEPGWRTALAVCHGGTNAMLLAWITGGGLAGLGPFDQDACCINVLDFDVVDGTVVRKLIRTVNATPYNLTKDGVYLSVIERLVAGELAR
ncbi:MAG: histidine phosphatase family protein [Betaproteobacteria bacterium]|nr:histidine phosphatase family protein [Betaproteobacteria bacterium]